MFQEMRSVWEIGLCYDVRRLRPDEMSHCGRSLYEGIGIVRDQKLT